MTAVEHLPANLGNLMQRHADPQAIAFIGLNAAMLEHRVTFGELGRMADDTARALLAAGHTRGDSVAILAANSVEYVAVLLGTMRAGLVAVPVNFKFPRQMIEYVLRDSGAAIVFCDTARAASVPADLPVVILDGDGDGGGVEPRATEGDAVRGTTTFPAFLKNNGQGQDAPFETVTPAPGETAMLLYTSGSSGTPKGVQLSHESHVWTVRTRLAADPLAGDRVLIAAPLYHMNALALALLTVAAHATAVLLPQFTAANYISAIGRYRCTWLTSVPPMIAMMLREQALLAATDLSSVRVIRMGSAPVSESLLARIHQLLPNARVINAYGTTEGGPVVFGPHPQGLPTPPMAVGYPHAKVEVRLANSEGHTGPEIANGVLQMKSPALMSGYHRRPDLKRPFTDDGFYITGDVFHRDADGFHTFVGRHDDMFVSGGENIYPGEVEKMLEQHPGVQQAAVVPIPDEIKGTKPIAFIVPVAGATPSADEIRQYALAHAPAYQHPRQVFFIDALPLASTNKIDRRALLADAQQRLADGQHG